MLVLLGRWGRTGRRPCVGDAAANIATVGIVDFQSGNNPARGDPLQQAGLNDQTASPRRNRLLARKSAGRANSARVDGSGTVPPPVIELVPSRRVAALSLPNGSDKLV